MADTLTNAAQATIQGQHKQKSYESAIGVQYTMKKIYIAFSYTVVTVLRSPTPYNWRTPIMPPGLAKLST